MQNDVTEFVGGNNLFLFLREKTAYHNINGLAAHVLYRENGKKTIFPLHSCKDYQYMDVKEDRSIMNEEFFDNENWYIRLLMEATDRMEINQTSSPVLHQ